MLRTEISTLSFLRMRRKKNFNLAFREAKNEEKDVNEFFFPSSFSHSLLQKMRDRWMEKKEKTEAGEVKRKKL